MIKKNMIKKTTYANFLSTVTQSQALEPPPIKNHSRMVASFLRTYHQGKTDSGQSRIKKLEPKFVAFRHEPPSYKSQSYSNHLGQTPPPPLQPLNHLCYLVLGQPFIHSSTQQSKVLPFTVKEWISTGWTAKQTKSCKVQSIHPKHTVSYSAKRELLHHSP